MVATSTKVEFVKSDTSLVSFNYKVNQIVVSQTEVVLATQNGILFVKELKVLEELYLKDQDVTHLV